MRRKAEAMRKNSNKSLVYLFLPLSMWVGGRKFASFGGHLHWFPAWWSGVRIPFLNVRNNSPAHLSLSLFIVLAYVLLPVLFWRSSTGIVYKQPAESCTDHAVRCDGVPDCSQSSDELDCGKSRRFGGARRRSLD